MRATRNAIKARKATEEAVDRLSVIEDRLSRIETLLMEFHQQGLISREEVEDTLTAKDEHAAAFAAGSHNPARKSKAKGDEQPEKA